MILHTVLSLEDTEANKSVQINSPHGAYISVKATDINDKK